MKQEFTFTYQKFDNISELNEIEQKLFTEACEARKKTYSPYSNFGVGCALLLENGEIIKGSNQENAAYPSGLCAERTTIFWTAANFPDVKILKLFVVGGSNDDLKAIAIPPCGSCRQSIMEYETKQKSNIEIYFSSTRGETYKVNSVRDLLPFTFDANFL